ncbi:hypothetical protein M2281_001250 [Mesorhizobium soli]|uniref:hypothetical protein n=1 Tax=Pseudaminobacter soli (ex Li et al. 2025) TaxID=1295366 RepID=UPI002473EFCF|nr:hypothetical protein [Mesorhizobium soli]MDH6230678.1 hypothetical protein [Mesorhizobium soli]
MIADGHQPCRESSRPIDPETIAAVSPLPPPEEIFVDWLMSVPAGADLEAAARKQMALIDRRTPLHPAAQCLRALLATMAGATEPRPLPRF